MKEHSSAFVPELNSVLSVSNLLTMTEQCTEHDAKVILLILWQKLSE